MFAVIVRSVFGPVPKCRLETFVMCADFLIANEDSDSNSESFEILRPDRTDLASAFQILAGKYHAPYGHPTSLFEPVSSNIR